MAQGLEAVEVEPEPVFPDFGTGTLTVKDTPMSTGRLLSDSDVTPDLKGRSAEVFKSLRALAMNHSVLCFFHPATLEFSAFVAA